MFGNLFGKKKEITLIAPITGKIISIGEVPDPTFSQKMIGDGAAIEPSEGKLLSPVDGEVIQVFPTMHALGVRTSQGLEILLHVGLETVALKGEGFRARVKAGDKVKTGTPLLDFDVEVIRAKANLVSPIVITNMELVSNIEILARGNLRAGETPFLKIFLK